MTNIDHFCFDILCGPRGSRVRDSSNELRVGMDIKGIHSIVSKDLHTATFGCLSIS
jgi:hypothetical protein